MVRCPHQAGSARHWPLQGPRGGRRYLDWFKATGKKSLKETEASVNAFILPGLATRLALAAARLRKWHAEIASAPPRLRTRPGANRRCAIQHPIQKRPAAAVPRPIAS